MPAANTWDSILVRISKDGPFSPLTNSNCWSWSGYKNQDGYARVSWKRRLTLVHRLTYETYVKQVPKGLELDHKCRNRSCVNPDHLEPVTHKENMSRGISRRAKQTHCINGHAFSYIDTTGARQCRICRNSYMRKLRASRKEVNKDS